MSEKRYRVVRTDVYDAFPDWTLSLREAQRNATEMNARCPTGTPGPYRVQELVESWVDVPVPLPLPELPDEVWMRTEPDGGLHEVTWFPMNLVMDYRVFRGRVVEWTEVEGP